MNPFSELAGRPDRFAALCWPNVNFYSKQREILEALVYSDEVVVPAGNMLGKDFVAGYVALSAFLCPRLYWPDGPATHEIRVVTTSVKDDHLRVLWGEIGRFIQTCAYPLLTQDRGTITYNHRDIRKLNPLTGNLCQISYLRGMVSERGEGMAGHHAAHTLLIIDEASGVDDVVYDQGITWAKKVLIIGNCHLTRNFFYRAVKEGNVPKVPA